VPDAAFTAGARRAHSVTGWSATWVPRYLRQAAGIDFAAAVVAAGMAVQLRFDGHPPGKYWALSLALPLLWLISLSVSGGYDARFIGSGPEEFRRVVNSGASLTAGFALLSYAAHSELPRGYLVISMPGVIVLDLVARLILRKRLHSLRSAGRCMSTVVAAGHQSGVAGLITELRRDTHHGLAVVAACLAGAPGVTEVAGVPVAGDLDDTAAVVRRCGAGTVAVLSCAEMDGVKLRQLAWALEKTGTELCVAPALLDVAGPRTTVRPVAGLTLLHVEHPQLSGPSQVLKDLFDRTAAALALILLWPVMLALAIAIRMSDRGPALFSQARVGKDGRLFKIYKFRTTVTGTDAP